MASDTPDNSPSPLAYARHWLAAHWTDLVFWGLLVVALMVLVQPVWVGHIPPTTDFGGHVAIADIWTRLDEVELYQQLFERRGGLLPNTVAARFTSLVYPAVDVLTGMRLFTTLTLVGTVGALLAVLRTFGRSRWLIFGALPLLWNGSFYWGMVNYFAIFPLFFAALALARKTGQTADWRWGVPLVVVCTFSFFVHGLGCPLTVASAALVLLFSMRTPWALPWFGAFAPPTALWIYWRKTTEGKGVPDAGILEVLQAGARWQGPNETFQHFVHQAMDATTAAWDVWGFGVLVGVWLVWMAVSRADEPTPNDERAADPTWNRRLRDLAARLYDQGRRHALLILAICLLFGALALPAYIEDTNVKTRLMPLFLWTAVCLPRLPRKNWLAGAATTVAVALSVWFGASLSSQAAQFNRVELEPMVELIDRLPEQPRVECLKVHSSQQPFFRGRPLDLNCPALVHTRKSGFGGFGFPEMAFNAVKFKEGAAYNTIRHTGYSNLGMLQQWDYLLVRGQGRGPREGVVEKVAEAGGKLEEGYDEPTQKWTLYRVVKDDFEASHRQRAGGDGGEPFQWACPDGEAMAGWRGSLLDNDTVASVRPICRKVLRAPGQSPPRPDDLPDRHPDKKLRDKKNPDEAAPQTLRLAGRSTRGPRTGSYGEKSFTARCPTGQFLVGLEGRDGLFVDQLNVLCAPVKTTDDGTLRWRKEDVRKIEGGGGDGGGPFRFTCPNDSVAKAAWGRSGSRVDSVGIGCVVIDKLKVE